MKRITMIAALLCLYALFLGGGAALAAGSGIVSIDHIEGMYNGDTLKAGQDLRFVIRLDNTLANGPGVKSDVSVGFRITSPDGAVWDSVTMDSTGYPFPSGESPLAVKFPVAYSFQNYYGNSAPGDPDTVGVLWSGQPTNANRQLPVGYNDTAMAVRTWLSAPAATNNGKHICIDSSFFQPGGTWSWNYGSTVITTIYPSWVGLPGQTHVDGQGYCFVIYDPNAPRVTIGAAPNPMNFNATENGTDPAPQYLHITSNSSPQTYNLNWEASWLDVNKTTGSTDDSVLVSPKVASLAPGTYLDSIQVAVAGATNSPLYVKVNFTVAARPKMLKLTPDTLAFAGIENGSNPASQGFSVQEVGGAAINYVASEIIPWAALTNPAGTTPGTVTVDVSLTGIPAGTYLDSILVTSASASNSPQWKFVRLVVSAPETKTLVTVPDTVFFVAQQGGANPPGSYFLVSEAAQKVIPWSAVKSAPWLGLDKTSGQTPDSINLSADITDLLPSTYYDSIIVTSSDAAVTNSRRVIVKLTVSPCPVLLASKTQYYDTVFVNEPAVIGDSIHITSSGEQLPWQVTLFGADFTIPVQSGTTPSVLSFTFNRTFADTGSFSTCFGVGTPIPGFRRANMDCISSFMVCVNTVVKQRPCIQLVESDTVLMFDGFEGSGYLPGKPFSVHVSDSTQPISFTISKPAGATWLKFVSGTDTLDAVNAVNLANIEVITNTNGLTPLFYAAQCTVSSDNPAVCAPGSRMFTVQLNVKKVIIPSTDTFLVSNVPAVPGAQVPVPVNFVNSCPLVELSAALAWDKANLHLDSVSFLGSRFAGGTTSAVIDNDLGHVSLDANAAANQPVPGGSGLLANLYFSVNPLAPSGVYQLTPVDSPGPGIFERRMCTDSITTEIPEYIKGGVVTDTVSDYICGWVVDPDGNQIPGATVELFAKFPQGSPEMTTTSTGIGSFAFSGMHTTPFDVYAYKSGYYPGLLTNLNFGAKGVKIVLKPLNQLTPTSEWVDYYCSENMLFGAPIPIGSVVEAMDGSLLVGRWVVTEIGKYGFMPVYRANDQFGDNGARSGDAITFFVNGYAAMTNDNTIYPSQYAQMQVCLDAGATITKTCELQPGWNLVSWSVDTPTDSITAVLNSIADCIDVVLGFEGGGLTYDPALPQFSTLWYADHLSGYWIKIKDECSATLTLTGLPVNPSTPIPVYAGWNLVSYLPDASMTPDVGFASVLNNLLVAYGWDNGVKVFKPGQPQFNTLTDLATCNGYWLKVGADGSLVYPSNTPTVTVASENQHSKAARLAAAASGVTPTTSWINLYSRNLMLNGKSVSAGSKVTAVTSNGVRVGSFTMKQNGVFGFMPVYSDAGSSDAITGLKPGDKFSLVIDGVTTDQTFEWTNNGDRIEVSNLTSKNNGNGNLPTSYSLAQNYPNPFNPSTTISFALPAAGSARLEVFNLLGALVATPFDGKLEAGTHQVVWDGRDSHGQTVASGVYFYRLSSGSYSETKKMMLLK